MSLIIIDSREPVKKILPIFESYRRQSPVLAQDLDFVVKALPYGDYMLRKDGVEMIIERKALADFAASDKDYLKQRLSHMRHDYELTGLLLEGTYILKVGNICLWRGPVLTPSMSFKTFTNFLTSQQEFHTTILNSYNMDGTVQVLLNTLEYLPRIGLVPPKKTEGGREFMLAIPSVGPEKLKELMTRFESPIVALQGYEEWAGKRELSVLSKW